MASESLDFSGALINLSRRAHRSSFLSSYGLHMVFVPFPMFHFWYYEKEAQVNPVEPQSITCAKFGYTHAGTARGCRRISKWGSLHIKYIARRLNKTSTTCTTRKEALIYLRTLIESKIGSTIFCLYWLRCSSFMHFIEYIVIIWCLLRSPQPYRYLIRLNLRWGASNLHLQPASSCLIDSRK